MAEMDAGGRGARAFASLALAALAVAIIPALSRAGGHDTRGIRLGEPQRFEPRGVDPSLLDSRASILRVSILLRTRPMLLPALGRREELTLDPTAAEQRLVASSTIEPRLSAAGSEQARRDRALRSLNSSALAAARAAKPVLLAIRQLGGRTVALDPLTSVVTATVPQAAIRRLAARRDVQAIMPAPPTKPLTLSAPTQAVGAPDWWAAGHTGGTGWTDARSVNLAIVGDPVYWVHPAFAGVNFETPPGAQMVDPNGGLHGTGVASMAIAQGASGCSLCQPADAQEKGVAPGIGRVLDTWAAVDELAWASGQPYTYWNADINDYSTQLGAQSPASVASYSRGVSESADDNLESQGWDSYVDGLGVSAAIAAGNSGPTAGSINEPADAYNVIAVGGFCCGANATDRSGDSVFSWSSEGPTIGGRKKPDLVAAGSADVADSLFNTDGTLWHYSTGTSYAAPQVAGAAALIAGSGVADQKVIKALLINSARPGRATPTSAMGSQTGWEPDWGWGELDLTDALAQRLNYEADSVPANGVRFYRATAGAAGDRATLVWDRRVTPCFHAGCAYQPAPYSTWQTYTLSHLALTELDASSGAVQGVSDSPEDNVQQVRAGGAGPVVYKVTAGDVDGLSAEPFALAAKDPLTPLVTPQPTLSLQLDHTGFIQAGTPVTVTAHVANPSPDLTAEGARVALALPPGVSVVSGSPSVSIGTLGTRGSGADTATVSWTVEGTSDGVKQLEASVTASRYGSTFASDATASFGVDSTPPTPTIASPEGASGVDIPVAWGATDPGSGVARYDVEVATDAGEFVPWLTASTQTAAVFTGAPGHSYVFAARATDRLGNVSAFVVSSTVTVPAPGGGTGAPRPFWGTGQHGTGRDPRLRLVRVNRTGSTISLVGATGRSVRGRVRVSAVATVGRRRIRVTATAVIRRGHFTATLRLPLAASGGRPLAVTVAFGGGRGFGAETRRLTVNSR